MNKTILILIALLLLPFSVSAISFNNLSVGGTGVVNTGNGYFNDDASQFLYPGSRNVYTITEDTQIHILEPISYAGGISGAVQVINSSFGTLKDSVVHNGYLYFVDGVILKKKNSRSNTGTCESNDTTPGGCIITITSGVGETLRVYNGVLYFTVGQTGFKHLDVDDNVVNDFIISASIGAQRAGFAVTSNNSVTQVYIQANGAPSYLQYCRSTGCTNFVSTGKNAPIPFNTFYVTQNYVYAHFYTQDAGGGTIESLYRVSNGSALSADYMSVDTVLQNNRAYVAGFSTIGLVVASTTTYETYNSNEVGISSLPLSEGSGIVEYVEKTVDVPNPTYYNDSIIPLNVNLKFIISDANHTNYSTSAFWHLKAFNPTGIEVEDHDLPIICTQSQPWWDPFGVLSLFLVDINTPWACDGTQTVIYSRTPGTFWLNGTWEVELTEQIPGTTSILSTDTWIITNASSSGTGSISQTPISGGGIGGTSEQVSAIANLLSSNLFWAVICTVGMMVMVAFSTSQKREP